MNMATSAIPRTETRKPIPRAAAEDGRAMTYLGVVDCPLFMDRGTGKSGKVCTTTVLATPTLASFKCCEGVFAVIGCAGGVKLENAREVIWRGWTFLKVRNGLMADTTDIPATD